MRAPHAVRASPSATFRLTALSVLLFVACAHREGCTGDYCGTLVIATAGEPESLLPPVITSAVGQAVSDQLFLKLADIGLSTNTSVSYDFQPQLAAASTFFLGRPHLRRVIWRLTPDLQVAVTQLVADQADAIEVLGPPDNLKRAQGAPQLTLYPYRGATYAYLGFNLAANGDSSRPHPLFGDRELRRALVMAVDRERLRQNVWGDAARVPPGPLPELWWIWDLETRSLRSDTAQASRLLTRLGWRASDRDSVRERHGTRLAFRIMVPTTSAARRQYARPPQEQYRSLGAEVELDEVEPTVFAQRAAAGRFDALLISWNA